MVDYSAHGDLSPILGRLKRTYSTRQLCSYILTHVRGNNIIEESPHRFSRWQKGLPLRCGRFSERPQRMLRRMPSSLSSSVSGIQLNCKCPGTRRLKNVKAKYHQHVSHKQVVGKRYLGAYKKKMLGSIQKKARDLVIEKKKKIIIV